MEDDDAFAGPIWEAEREIASIRSTMSRLRVSYMEHNVCLEHWQTVREAAIRAQAAHAFATRKRDDLAASRSECSIGSKRARVVDAEDVPRSASSSSSSQMDPTQHCPPTSRGVA